MSSPVTAWEGCSRLSAYLAWGCISLRNVHQRTKAVADVLRAAKGRAGKATGSSSAGPKKRQRRGKSAAGSDSCSGDEDEDDGLEGEADEGADAEPGEAAQQGATAAAAGGSAAGTSSGQPGLKDFAAFTARLRWRSHFMQVWWDTGQARGTCPANGMLAAGCASHAQPCARDTLQAVQWGGQQSLACLSGLAAAQDRPIKTMPACPMLGNYTEA